VIATGIEIVIKTETVIIEAAVEIRKEYDLTMVDVADRMIITWTVKGIGVNENVSVNVTAIMIAGNDHDHVHVRPLAIDHDRAIDAVADGGAVGHDQGHDLTIVVTGEGA